MAEKKARGPFEGLPCPHCGALDSLSVKVPTLALECAECSEEVTRADVAALVRKFDLLLAWIDRARSD